jgi:hypothetical protein
MMAIARAAQDAKAPTIYRASHFEKGGQQRDTEPPVIYDYDTGTVLKQ